MKINHQACSVAIDQECYAMINKGATQPSTETFPWKIESTRSTNSTEIKTKYVFIQHL